MNVQSVIDTATVAAATQLGNAAAADNYRKQLKASYVIETMLSAKQRKRFDKMCPFPVVHLGRDTNTGDHAVLAACREAIRLAYQRTLGVPEQLIGQKVLVIGASGREVKHYDNYPNVEYYFHNTEGKDYVRVLAPLLKDLANSLKKRAKRSHPIFVQAADSGESYDTYKCEKMSAKCRRYWTLKEVLYDLCQAKDDGKLHRYHTNLVPCDVMLFEDSLYNVTSKDLCDMFETTGSNVAYGYGLYPWELLFDNMPANDDYIYSESYQNGELWSHFGYRNGGCANGYTHPKESWSWLLRCPKLTNGRTTVVVEIVSRVGPMTLFKCYKSNNDEKIYRTISLPTHLEYVQILDLEASVFFVSKKPKWELKYFSVLRSEFEDLREYLSAVAPQSLTIQNARSFARRRAGGMSLVTKELIESWTLPEADRERFVQLVLLYVLCENESVQRLLDVHSPKNTITSMFKALGNYVGAFFSLPIRTLINWVLSHSMTRKLVLNKEGMVHQFDVVHGVPFKGPVATLNPTFVFDDKDDVSCPFCRSMEGKWGSQKCECGYKESSFHTFQMSEEEVNKFRISLGDTDSDAPALKKVKEDAKAAYPKTGFECTCRVEHIRGGPGCGKSEIIRQLATMDDLIIAPFFRLKKDYAKSLETDKEYLFKTTHHSLTVKSAKRLFVDEWTSMPYEVVSAIAYTCGVECVYLVGDDRQSKLIDEKEGIYIGSKISLDTISTHELLVNFRNGRDVVALLNREYNYKMIPNSTLQRTITIEPITEAQRTTGSMTLAFSTANAKTYCQDESNTVRAAQGASAERVELFMDCADRSTSSVECLQIVALSRHKQELCIFTDDSEESKKFTGRLHISDEEITSYAINYDPKSPEKIDRVDLDHISFDDTRELIDCEFTKSRSKFSQHTKPNKEKELESVAYYKRYPNHYGCALQFMHQLGSKQYKYGGALHGLVDLLTPNSRDGSKWLDSFEMIKTLCENTINERVVDSPFGVLDFEEDIKTCSIGPSYGAAVVDILNVSVLWVEDDFIHTFRLSNQPECLVIRQKGEHLFVFEAQDWQSVLGCEIPGSNCTQLRDNTTVVETNQFPEPIVEPKSIDELNHDSTNTNGSSNQNNGDLTDQSDHESCDSSNDSYPKPQGWSRIPKPDRANEEFHKDVSTYSKQHGGPEKFFDFRGLMVANMEMNSTVEEFLSSKNLTSHQTISDGNCLYHALSPLLTGREGRWVNSKRLIFQTLGKTRWIMSRLDFEVYGNLPKFATPNYWGSADFAYAAAIISKRVVVVVSENYMRWFVPVGFDLRTPYFLIHKGNHFEWACAPTVIGGFNKDVYMPIDNVGYEIVTRSHSKWSDAEGSGRVNPEYALHVQTFRTVNRSYPTYEFYRDLDRTYIPNDHPVSDAYLLSLELLPRVGCSAEESLNNLHSQFIFDNFRTGTCNPNILCPINMRGHPKTTTEKFWSASMGNGLHYSGVKTAQTVRVCEARYIGRKKTYRFGHGEQMLATKLIDLWFEEHMDVGNCDFDSIMADAVFLGQLEQSLEKHYPEKYGGFSDHRARIVNFSLKMIFKPKLLGFDTMKPGQGISAWSTTAQSLFCGAFRVLSELGRRCEKPYVLPFEIKANVMSKVCNDGCEKDLPALCELFNACWSPSTEVDYVNEAIKFDPCTKNHATIEYSASDLPFTIIHFRDIAFPKFYVENQNTSTELTKTVVNWHAIRPIPSTAYLEHDTSIVYWDEKDEWFYTWLTIPEEYRYVGQWFEELDE